MSVPTIGNYGDVSVSPPAPQAAAVRDVPLQSSLKPQTPSQQPPQPSRDEVQKAMQAIKEKIEPLSPDNNLQFSVDQDSGTIVAKITDTKTGDTVLQIPGKEVLAIAKDLDRIKGLLLQQKA